MSAKILYKRLNLKMDYDEYCDHLGYLIYFTMNRIGNDFHEYGLNGSIFENNDGKSIFGPLKESKTNPTVSDTSFSDDFIVIWKFSILSKYTYLEYKFMPRNVSMSQISTFAGNIKDNINSFNKNLIKVVEMSIKDERISYMELTQVMTFVDPTQHDVLTITYEFRNKIIT